MFYVAVAVALYVADHIFRIYRTTICQANITVISELRSTRIEIAKIAGGWRAGQHVRLRILSTQMGWWGWTEQHPLTIASASDSDDGLVLLCKNIGPWSSKLYHLASETKDVGRRSRKVRMMIEGPYGMPIGK